MKHRHILHLLLLALLLAVAPVTGAQSVILCEDFEGHDELNGFRPDGWGFDYDEFVNAGFGTSIGTEGNPILYISMGIAASGGLYARFINGGHGITMTLPTGVDWSGQMLTFQVGNRNITPPNSTLVIGTQENDTAYSTFRLLDSIALPSSETPTGWIPVAVALDSIPTGHNTLCIRWHEDNASHRQLSFSIDNLTITSLFARNMRVLGHGATSVTLDWEASAGSNVILYMYDNYNAPEPVSYTSLPAVVEGLQPGRNYTFIIRPSVDSLALACRHLADSVTIYLPDDHGSCIAYDDFYGSETQAFYGLFQNPYTDTNFIDFGKNSMYSRHTVHWDTTEYDPRTGGQLRTIPEGYSSSVRLGNWNVGREAESMLYTVTVDTLDYDLIVLHYASVLQDPNHPSIQQPHFLFELLDENYQKIDPTCGAADFVASSSLGWNSFNDLLWKDWTTVGFSVKAYQGRTIHVRLTTFDCGAGAHYGYAYFVLDCAQSTIRVSNCHGAATVTLTAPSGFNYSWYRSTDSATIISTQQSISVPIDGSLYHCRTSFVDRPECSFTVSAHAIAAHNVAAIDTAVTFDSCTMYVAFHNASSLISGTDGTYDTTAYPGNAQWDFAGGLASTASDTVIAFTQPGNYNVTLTSDYADCQDVATIEIVVPVPASTHRDTVATACDSLHWRGFSVYCIADSSHHLELTDTFHFPNPYGCDSTLTLHLDIHPSYLIHDTTLFCFVDSLSYGGTTYVADTVLPLAYSSVYGCDSIRPLLLTHRPPLPPVAMTISNIVDTFAVGHPLAGCSEMPLVAVDTSHVSAWRWSVSERLQQGESRSNSAAEWSLGAGCWTLALVRTDSIGCTDTTRIDSVAIVMPSPHASFTIAPKRIPILGATTTMQNTSAPDTCSWLWYNATDSVTSRDWSYRWPEVSAASDELVTLVATLRHDVILNDSLVTIFCTDTAVDTVHIVIPWLDFPSLVTPNGDGVNDIWGIVGLLEEGWFPQNELWIFNEWGVLVYHVRDISSPDQFWDPNERPCPDGAYFYRFAARSKYGIVRRNGVIEVLRK